MPKTQSLIQFMANTTQDTTRDTHLVHVIHPYHGCYMNAVCS